MATSTLRYLQDDQDPLNQLLAGGGDPPVPEAPPEPQQQPARDDVPANPYSGGGELEQSLLNAPPPSNPEPMPVKMRDSYAEQGAPAPQARGGSKDTELDAAYRSAQMDALQHAKFDDKGYGVGEGLRDNGAALIASILDIGFNKGRGLGNIVGATAQEVGRQADGREKERKAAQDFALRARTAGLQRGDADYRQGLLAVDQRNADLREREIALRENGGQRSAKGLPAKLDASSTAPYGSPPDLPAGDDYSQLQPKGYDQTPPEPGSEARSEADIDAPARDAGSPPAPAGGIPTTGPNGKPLTDAQLRARQRDDLATSPFPGIQVDDPKAWAAAVPDPTRRAAHEKYIGGATTSINALDRMIELRKAVGPAWNSLDDEQKRVKLDEMANLQKAVIGGLATVGNSGVLNGSEFPRYAADIPDGSFGKTDLYDQLLGAAMSPRDTQLEKLQGARAALAGSTNAGLRLAGARLADGKPQPAAAPQKPPAFGFRPETIADPNNLGDLGGRNAGAPPVNEALGYPPPTEAHNQPSNGGGVHHVRKPDGSIVQTMKSPDELTKLPRGWTVMD
jgi:hypothetical protein